MTIEKSVLRQAQLLLLEGLKEIDRICNKHSINYWIDSGTLLGAKRHGGFIPWDDDIDICMTRKDYNRFIDICSEELNQKKYFLQTVKSDPYYININVPCKLRILKTKTIQKFEIKYQCYDERAQNGLFIDIFPFDKYSKNNLIKKHIEKSLSVLFFIKLISYFNDFKKIKGIKRLVSPFIKYIGKMIPRNFLISITTKIAHKMSLRKINYIYAPCIEFIWLFKVTFEENEIFPLKEIKFEDAIFKCPNDLHKYLVKYYGDSYMELPPENKREYHFEKIEL
ncbi:LicD family protein [Candidatus Williamhamiltonella defendens]|uniref:LicD family protein n=2 Tax=Candidatus Williamhamiltonella defendens TaxID=138072 RepID=UPI00061897C9|nr:LicD family protein [Candidatus Hamiltonella defensa]CED79662.1 Lipopolysaccharide cholinephosphotransferase LicD family protein [Candidatus Hamiltonella defensa (Bemisia tabaci)]